MADRQKTLVWLALIVVLGALLRLYRLTDLPPSLNWDEVSLGYNAYSLFKTGRDEWGVQLPAIFRAYGDYKLPGYVYLTVVSQALLGLTPLAVRLPSVLAGIGLIAATYLLTTRLLQSRLTAFLAALLVAISPWSLWLSRMAVEANLATFLATAGTAFLVGGQLTLGVLLLGLSAWTYNSLRIFAPLFLAALTVWRLVRWNKTSAVLALFLFGPLFFQLLSPSGQARYRWLALLDAGAINSINQARGASRLPGVWPWLIHNKATYAAFQFSKNYLSYFSPDFLFLKGGSHYQFSLPGHGLLSVVNLPFLVVGFVWLLRSKSPASRLLLAWLLLGPIPGSLTRDSPHVLRAALMLPALALTVAVGVRRLVPKLPLAVYLAAIFLSLEFYIYPTAFNYRLRYSWAWQYGYQQTVQFIKQHYSEYDQVVFTKRYGEPHEYVLYFWPWEPRRYQTDQGKVWDYHANWYWVDGFAKFRFINDWEMLDYVSSLPAGGRYLVVASPENEPSGREVYRVNFLDNKPAFIIKEL